MFPPLFPARALELLPVNATSGYRYFSSPADVVFDGDGNVFVADQNYGVFYFDGNCELKSIIAVPGASRYGGIACNGNVLAGLADGKLFIKYISGGQIADGDSSAVTGAYTALTAGGGTFYALRDNGKIDAISVDASGPSDIIAALDRQIDPGIPDIVSVCAINGALVFASGGTRSGTLSYYGIQASRVLHEIPGLPPIRHIAAAEEKNRFADHAASCVTAIHLNGEIVKYDMETGRIEAWIDRSNGSLSAPARVSAHDSAVYISDSETLAVNEYDLETLSFVKAFFYSKGSEPGRLNNPQGLCVWDKNLIVADTANKRVQVWKPDGTADEIFGGGDTVKGGNGGVFTAPHDVCTDAEGNLYAADNRTDIYTFEPVNEASDPSANGKLQFKERTVLRGGRASITSIAAAPDGTLYAADRLNNGIWLMKDGAVEMPYDITAPVSLAASHNYPVAFCLTADGSIYILKTGGAAEPLQTENGAVKMPGAKYITADAADNLFIYAEDVPPDPYKIVKYSPVDILAAAYKFDPLDADAFGYGDALPAGISGIACDPLTGIIYLADRTWSLISQLSPYGKTEPLPAPADYGRHPVDYVQAEAVTAVEIARTTSGTAVFNIPYAAKPMAYLEANAPVVVLERALPDNLYFSYVLLPETGKAGYVIKTALGQQIAPEKPSFTYGQAFIENAPVYKYPSKRAPLLATLPKEKTVELQPMPPVQLGGDKWYCIVFDDKAQTVGFIDALNVANSLYRPSNGTLATNAAIKNPAGATLYGKNSAGQYADLSVILPDGARVKIDGVFDPNSEYTKVTYHDGEFGLIEGYIKTRYIKYDTVTRFQMIMLGALIALLAGAAAVFIVVRKKKAHRK